MAHSTQTKNLNNTKAHEVLQIVSFNLGEEDFGVDILKVQEINRMANITRVPNTPDYVEGVINLRGKVIPIIDLRVRFGMNRKERDNSTRIVVVEYAGKIVGFVVDAVREVLRVPTDIMEPPPKLIANVAADYIEAVGKFENRILILLNLDNILSAALVEVEEVV